MGLIADIYERWGGTGCLAFATMVVITAWLLRWAVGW